MIDSATRERRVARTMALLNRENARLRRENHDLRVKVRKAEEHIPVTSRRSYELSIVDIAEEGRW